MREEEREKQKEQEPRRGRGSESRGEESCRGWTCVLCGAPNNCEDESCWVCGGTVAGGEDCSAC